MSNDSPDRTASRVTLEQWRVLCAVVDAGTYASAASALHKSQSAVTYAIQKLERQLGVGVFEREGRKAVLTATGQVLYRRAGALLEEAAALETAAGALGQGWESAIRLAVDATFPTWLLLDCLGRFSTRHPAIRIELYETVLGGSSEALKDRSIDLAISPFVPKGAFGEPLLRVRFVAVAAPDHPLHALGRTLTRSDLRRHRQLVLRDSDSRRRRDAGWLGSEARWTVSHKATSIRAACMGLGFAWYSEATIRDELASGALKPLPLREGSNRYAELYLVYADTDYAGPGTRELAGLILAAVRPPSPGIAGAQGAASRSRGG